MQEVCRVFLSRTVPLRPPLTSTSSPVTRTGSLGLASPGQNGILVEVWVWQARSAYRISGGTGVAASGRPKPGRVSEIYDSDRTAGMRKTMWALLLVGFMGSLTLPAAAEAQVFTPTFMAPRPAADMGVYLSNGPGDFSVEGIWRRNMGEYDLGLRAGLADTPDLSVMVGADLRNPVAIGAPLDMAITGAAQGLFGGTSAVGFSLGLSIGSTFGAAELAFTPYLHPRVALVQTKRGSGFDADLLADLGLDVRISPALDLRLGVALDDRGGDWGIGFAWR